MGNILLSTIYLKSGMIREMASWNFAKLSASEILHDKRGDL